MGSSTMTAGGGASCATAGCMIHAAATNSAVRTIKSGEPCRQPSNFIPFIEIPLIFVLAAYILWARGVIRQSTKNCSEILAERFTADNAARAATLGHKRLAFLSAEVATGMTKKACREPLVARTLYYKVCPRCKFQAPSLAACPALFAAAEPAGSSVVHCCFCRRCRFVLVPGMAS
jgi:hypothetical protein